MLTLNDINIRATLGRLVSEKCIIFILSFDTQLLLSCVEMCFLQVFHYLWILWVFIFKEKARPKEGHRYGSSCVSCIWTQDVMSGMYLLRIMSMCFLLRSWWLNFGDNVQTLLMKLLHWYWYLGSFNLYDVSCVVFYFRNLICGGDSQH